MVRTKNCEHVRLTPGNWIAICTLVFTIITSLMVGVWMIANVTSDLRTEIKVLGKIVDGNKSSVDRLKIRIDKIEDRK